MLNIEYSEICLYISQCTNINSIKNLYNLITLNSYFMHETTSELSKVILNIDFTNFWENSKSSVYNIELAYTTDFNNRFFNINIIIIMNNSFKLII